MEKKNHLLEAKLQISNSSLDVLIENKTVIVILQTHFFWRDLDELNAC